MKKIIPLLMVVVLLLCGCGEKSTTKDEPTPVEQVEEMISALGTITPDSIDNIHAVQEAYNALDDNQQNQVANYEDLLKVWDTYYELIIAGQWCDSYILVNSLDPYMIDQMYAVDLTLNNDMTYTTTVTGEETSGTWYVSYGTLHLGPDSSNEFYIEQREDGIHLSSYAYGDFCKAEPFRQVIDEAFLVVDLAEVAPAEYISFTSYEWEAVDEWGDPSGWTYVSPGMESLLYDQGWIYVTCSDYLADIVIPAHTGTSTYPNGQTSSYNEEEYVYTHSWGPFGEIGCNFDFKMVRPEVTVDANLTPEEFYISRIKGTLVFVNSKYATVRNESGYRYVDVDVNGNTASYYFGRWIEGLDY